MACSSPVMNKGCGSDRTLTLLKSYPLGSDCPDKSWMRGLSMALRCARLCQVTRRLFFHPIHWLFHRFELEFYQRIVASPIRGVLPHTNSIISCAPRMDMTGTPRLQGWRHVARRLIILGPVT